MYVQYVDIYCELKVWLCEILYMLAGEFMRRVVRSENYLWCIECMIIYGHSGVVIIIVLLLLSDYLYLD